MGDVKDALVRLGVIEEKDRSSIHIRFTNLTRKTAIRDIQVEPDQHLRLGEGHPQEDEQGAG